MNWLKFARVVSCLVNTYGWSEEQATNHVRVFNLLDQGLYGRSGNCYPLKNFNAAEIAAWKALSDVDGVDEYRRRISEKIAAEALKDNVRLSVWLLIQEEFQLSERNKPKEQISSAMEKFVLEMAQVASDYQFGCEFIDDDMSIAMAEKAIGLYQEQRSEEKEHSPSDFFLNALAGRIGYAMNEGVVPPNVCTMWFNELDNFLRTRPKYRTEMAINLMSNWQSALAQHSFF